jgi:hypothetical protein
MTWRLEFERIDIDIDFDVDRCRCGCVGLVRKGRRCIVLVEY